MQPCSQAVNRKNKLEHRYRSESLCVHSLPWDQKINLLKVQPRHSNACICRTVRQNKVISQTQTNQRYHISDRHSMTSLALGAFRTLCAHMYIERLEIWLQNTSSVHCSLTDRCDNVKQAWAGHRIRSSTGDQTGSLPSVYRQVLTSTPAALNPGILVWKHYIIITIY